MRPRPAPALSGAVESVGTLVPGGIKMENKKEARSDAPGVCGSEVCDDGGCVPFPPLVCVYRSVWMYTQ